MAYFGEGRGPIHMDNVACTGSERALADCLKQEIGRHNCRHSEDAGVICDYFGKKAPGTGDKGKSPSGPCSPPSHDREQYPHSPAPAQECPAAWGRSCPAALQAVTVRVVGVLKAALTFTS